MKKYFSRIIIPFFVLAILFGVFGIDKTYATNEIPNVNIDLNTNLTPEQQMGVQGQVDSANLQNQNVNSPDYYNNNLQFQEGVNSPNQTGVNGAPPSTGNWYDWILQSLKSLAEGPLKIALGIIAGIYQLVVIPVLGAFVKITAACLDLAMKFTLESKNISNVDGAITSAWVIIRNIFNITFIFILLWSAIQMIVGVGSAGAKKMVANVIIAALLINFSLFVTRILIDVGNILAVTLYNSATINGSVSMSTIIANTLGLGSIFGTTGVDCTFCTEFFIVTAIQSLTMLIAIIVLAYIAMLMLVRTVVLIFLMVLSPIGFMGSILPKIGEYSKMWWENLYGQIFVAPIFLLFFYLIVKIGADLNPGISADKETAAYTIYFKYILIIVLLFAAVKITKKMSGVVGAAVEKFGAAAAGIAVGAATGGAALLARQTIGRGAASLAANEGLANAASKGGLGGFASRMVLKSANSTSKASFDARNTSSFKAATGFVGDQTGIKVDYNRGIKTQKDGYQGMVERQEKKSTETAKLIDKAGVSVSVGEKFARRNELDNERRQTIATKEAEKLALGMLDTEEKKKKHNELEKEIKDINSKIGSDSDKEITEHIEKTKKAARLKAYGDSEEKSVFNKFYRNKRDSKSAAKKIREAGNKKDGKTLAAEAAKALAEEEAKAKGENTTPSTPPTPAAPKP